MSRSTESPYLWATATSLTAAGDLTFQQEEKAIALIQQIIQQSPDAACRQQAKYAAEDLVLADEEIARAAIALGTAPGQDPNHIKDANNELIAAQASIAQGNYQDAISHYEHAWQDAEAAQAIKQDDATINALKTTWHNDGDDDDDDDCH